MAEARGNFRGNSRGSGRGGQSSRGAAGGNAGNRGHDRQQQGGEKERPKKENILDLAKYTDKKLVVKFSGGREVTGILKGFDQLMNLVLDEVVETVRDDEGNTATRPLGLVVARGTLLTSIAPADGSEEIANPFTAED